MAQQGVEIDTVDPLEILVHQLGHASGAAEVLGRLVSDLEDIFGPNHVGEEVPHVLVKMWNEERDRTARLAKIAMDAGVAEQQVRLADKQAQIIARVFTATLDDATLGLTPEQQAEGRKVAARHLRALEK